MSISNRSSNKQFSDQVVKDLVWLVAKESESDPQSSINQLCRKVLEEYMKLHGRSEGCPRKPSVAALCLWWQKDERFNYPRNRVQSGVSGQTRPTYHSLQRENEALKRRIKELEGG